MPGFLSRLNTLMKKETMTTGNNLVLENPVYQKNKMHIDGIQELNEMYGYRIMLIEDDMVIYRYDDIKNIK